MAKRRPSKSLQGLSGGRAGNSTAQLNLPQHAPTRDFMRVYLALCCIGALDLDVRKLTGTLRTDYGVTRGENAVGAYLRSGDRECIELWAHLKNGGPETADVKKWKQEALDEQATWKSEEGGEA